MLYLSKCMKSSKCELRGQKYIFTYKMNITQGDSVDFSIPYR